MKKLVYIFSLLTLVLCAYSCQNSIDTAKESLTITATIAEPDASRVALTDNGETLRPEWSEGDKVIGFDEEGDTFEFTVESITDRRATMSAGGYVAVDGRKVYAIYAPGYKQTDISDDKLTVNIGAQNGGVDKSQPFLMCATATVDGSNINLVFENQVAVVGLKKFKINPVDVATNVDHLVLNGAVASGTFQIVDSKLQLVPSGSPAPITAAGTWNTDASGVYNSPVYFAVLPTTDANLELHAVATNDKYVNLASIPATTLSAGFYYRMSKILDAVADVDGVKYDNIDDAWAAANAATTDVTVTLLANCSAASTLKLDNSKSGTGAISLDLNGKELTGPASSYTIDIRNSRSLTVCDNSTSTIADQGAIIGVSNAHTLFAESSTIDITGGTIKAPSGHEKAALWIQTSSSATMSGGKLDASSSNYRAAYVGSGSSLTISDGDIESKLHCIYSTGTTTITGGIFESETTYPVYSVGTGNVSVSGGYFSSQDSSVELFNVAKSSGNTGVCYVIGGFFDRAINSNRTRTSGNNPRCHSLNTEAATKDQYPFKVLNGSYAYPFVDTVGSYSYWHATLASAALQAQRATNDVKMQLRATPANAQPAVNLTNTAGNTVTLNLKGYTLSTTSQSFISTSGTLVIQDTGASKGKITSTKSKVIDITAKDANVTLDGVVIESKATGGDALTDAVVHMESSGGTMDISNSSIYSTQKLSILRAYDGTTTITDSELSSGIDSEGWYVIIGANEAAVTINSGSFYTSGTDKASTCHIAYDAASITVEDGYFYSEGRAVSAGNKSYYEKITLNGGYYNKTPSVPTSGTGQDSPNYGSGLSMQSITPVPFPHSTITEKTCGYQVKADGGEAEAQASMLTPVANYGNAISGIIF